MGTTLVHFEHYGRDQIQNGTCSAGPVCFGATLKNEEGDPYQFTSVLVQGGLIVGYSQNFPTGTSLATAQADIMQYMPSDATASAVVVDHTNGSCGMFNITSRTLGTIFSTQGIGDPSGVVGVELSYVDANLNSVYDPSNIESASIGTMASDPTTGC